MRTCRSEHQCQLSKSNAALRTLGESGEKGSSSSLGTRFRKGTEAQKAAPPWPGRLPRDAAGSVSCGGGVGALHLWAVAMRREHARQTVQRQQLWCC